MSKLLPTTSLDDAIRRVADRHTGAASVISMLNIQRPQHVMDYLRQLDKKKIYGDGVYYLFMHTCKGNLNKFVEELSKE